MSIKEFEIIRRFFRPLSQTSDWLPLGIGDDAAVLEIPEDSQLVIASDTLNEAVHFPKGFSAFNTAYRALMCNVSDMAAMGAEPLGYQLQLSLPEVDESWLEQFAQGLRSAANDAGGVSLMGGDTTKGPLSIAITCLGAVPKHQALRRAGAKSGDLIFHSGQLGIGAQGLADYYTDKMSTEAYQWFCCPIARIELGQSLLGFASSAIDISDGLDSDLEHLCEASQVQAIINLERLNIYASSSSSDFGKAIERALFGGDDYELCFTLSVENYHRWQQQFPKLANTITQVGQIESLVSESSETLPQKRVQYLLNSEKITMKGRSFEHFSN